MDGRILQEMLGYMMEEWPWFQSWDSFVREYRLYPLWFLVLFCKQIIFPYNFSLMSHSQFPNHPLKATCYFPDSSSSQATHPSSPLSSLSSSVNEQSKQRMVSKYERQLKIKDNQLAALGNNLSKCQEEMAKCVNQNHALKKERLTLQQRVNRMDRERQEQKNALTKEYESKIANQGKQVAIVQSTILKLNQQITSLHDKQAITQKQHKVYMRRLTNTLEETRSQLQGKLSIKHKQQDKIEALLQSRKKEMESRLNEKDQELAALEKERHGLKQERERLQGELMALQAQKIEEYKLFSEELKSMEQKVIQARQAHASLAETITASLHKFKNKLQLASEDDDISRLIQKFQRELSIRKDPISYEQTIAKYQQKISGLLISDKELRHKIGVLQDEMAFIRTRNAQSHDFKAAIESHMQQLDSKLALSSITAKRNKPIQSSKENRKTAISAISIVPPITLQEKSPKNPLNILNANICHSLQLPKMPAEQDAERIGKGRSANDYLKEELQSKKKSLIYLMYRPHPEQQNDPTAPLAPQKQTKENLTHSKSSSGPIRRRSNSLGNLISAKCRQRLS